MKTNVTVVSGKGAQMETALAQMDKVADDVKVFIRGRIVETTIIKKLN